MAADAAKYIAEKSGQNVLRIKDHQERQQRVKLERLAKIMTKLHGKEAFETWAAPTKEKKKRIREEAETAQQEVERTEQAKRRRLQEELKERVPGMGLYLPRDISRVERLEDIPHIERILCENGKKR